MFDFSQDDPAAAAERLISWTRRSLEVPGSLALPGELSGRGLVEWVEGLELAGDRFGCALHFGAAAVARQTGIECLRELGLSLQRCRQVPPCRDEHGIGLLALGMVVDPRTIDWLDELEGMSDPWWEAVGSHLLESGRSEVIEAFTGKLEAHAGRSARESWIKATAYRGYYDSTALLLHPGMAGSIDPDFLRDLEKRLRLLGETSAVDRLLAGFPGYPFTEWSQESSEEARLQAQIEAGAWDELFRLLQDRDAEEGVPYAVRQAAFRCANALMDRGEWERGLRLFRRFGYWAAEGKAIGWLDDLVAAWGLPKTIEIYLEWSEANGPDLAAALANRGKSDVAESMIDRIEAPGWRARTWIRLARAVRTSGKDDGEAAKRWLERAESEVEATAEQDHGAGPPCFDRAATIRELLSERWHWGERDSFQRWERERLDRYRELLAEDNREEAIDLLEDVALGWVEIGAFDRLVEYSAQFSVKEEWYDIAQHYFGTTWDPERDTERWLSLMNDGENYCQERWLTWMVERLSEKDDAERAGKVAAHLRERFATEVGFEILGDWFRSQGRYEEARQVGGADGLGFFRFSGGRSLADFRIGQDDEEAIDYITATKGWESRATWLLPLGWHGRTRVAVEKMAAAHLDSRLPSWLTHPGEAREDEPKDFAGVMKAAKEQAKYRLWREGEGKAPRTPLSINLLLIQVSIVQWILKVLTGDRRNYEREIELDIESKRLGLQQEIDAEVPGIARKDPGPDRFRELVGLARKVASRDGIRAPEVLIRALDEEGQRLEGNGIPVEPREAEAWRDLGRAYLELGEIARSAEAYSKLRCREEIGEHLVRKLVERVPKADWHRVAPLCGISPVGAATLAVKLSKWFPKARISLPRD